MDAAGSIRFSRRIVRCPSLSSGHKFRSTFGIGLKNYFTRFEIRIASIKAAFFVFRDLLMLEIFEILIVDLTSYVLQNG